MKKLIIGLMVVMSSSVFASQALFDALDTEEVVLPSPRAELHVQKSIAGLTCLKVDHIVDGLSFSCEAEVEELNSELLYKSLKLEEIMLPTPRTYSIHQKSVSNVTCLKTTDIDGNDSFSCKIKF